MQLKKLIFLLFILAFLFPATANGGDINVEAGDVRVRTEQGGGTSVETRSNRIDVDRQRSRSTPWWKPWEYYNRHRSSSNCSSSTYQRSTQTTRVNGKVQTNSISTSSCR